MGDKKGPNFLSVCVGNEIGSEQNEEPNRAPPGTLQDGTLSKGSDPKMSSGEHSERGGGTGNWDRRGGGSEKTGGA